MATTLLAIDPSLAAPGYAVLDLSRAEPHLIAAGAWETAPDKNAESKSADMLRRVLYIWRELRKVIALHQPQLIAIESGAGSTNAKTAAAMARASTVAACAADEHLNGGAPIYITAMAAGAALGIGVTQRATKARPSAEEKAARKAAAERKKYLGGKRMAELTPEEQAEKRALTKGAAKKRDERKAAIAKAVVDRLGLARWARALGLVDRAVSYDELVDPRWEGAHDAAAIALVAWELPEVAAHRMVARQTTLAEIGGGRSVRAREGSGRVLYGGPPLDDEVV
ncbi:MAG TPA: crossover junction endodeoxyribonuclease RuvC [Myxococcota bacterium]|nr:crossover junction endodeoxyribonuclease RuvC [Myxococcota bacterium]